MSQPALTDETMRLLKAAQAAPNADLAKSITQATLLTAYDLQAPAKNLYPVITLLRNAIPRIPGGTGPATNWRQVSAITGSGNPAQGWVPEGQRSARMSYTTAAKAATYVTIGEEDQVSYEAISAGVGFEDVQARMVMRLLQQTMIKEEHAIFGGNTSLSLATPTTPTVADGGAGGTLGAATYFVKVVALTYEGFQNASPSAVPPTVISSTVVTGADGQTYTVNGGLSNVSSEASVALGANHFLNCSTPPVVGAVAYAWYVSVSTGTEKLEKITTTNSAQFSAPLTGTGAAPVASNTSTNTLAFDGLLTTAYNYNSGSNVTSLATGTIGTGTFLTASGRGSCVEIDSILMKLWTNFRLGPTAIYCNAQELLNITNRVLTGQSGAPLARYQFDSSGGPLGFVASNLISGYFNPFTLNGGSTVPVKIHPFLPPGTIYFHCDNLPVQYQSNQVPNVAEVKCRRDYYQINWPIVTRAQQVGVYSEEVLAVYAPFALWVLNNIGNG